MVSIIDVGVVFFANLFNLLIAGIMLSRPRRMARLERNLGLMAISLAVPMAIALLNNLLTGRVWWSWVIPAIFLLHSLQELILDYWLKLPFRNTRWLGPYLVVFYLAQWGLIGYAFQITVPGGYLTLVTYFISLGATAYSYLKVGHGEQADA